jgi:tetratricopeptide (TPR) repeat protein
VVGFGIIAHQQVRNVTLLQWSQYIEVFGFASSLKVPYIFNSMRLYSCFMNFYAAVCKLALLGMLVFSGGLSVQAQTVTAVTYKGTAHDEVQKSMQAREWFNALSQVDLYLTQQPRDPQMRFWRARLLEQLKQPEEALETYLALSQDYPELPEVQNNLGVMLAAKGRVDEARVAFEHALRNNPNYATAHENLGDIYLHLAQRSYDNAFRLSNITQSITVKITALESALQLTVAPP